MADATGSVHALQAEDDAPALSGVHRRQRGLTGIMLSGGSGSSPIWLLVMLLIGGGGGSALGANVFSDGDGAEALGRIQATELKIDAIERQHAELSADQDELERRVAMSNRRIISWIAECLMRQSNALGALANHHGLEVDVSVPPLLPDAGDLQ